MAWRRSCTPSFMWKVDFAKAYDSIDWRYLWNALRRLGFPEKWVQWMKLCVTTSSCSVLINGRAQGGWFQLQRGIREGCPLAPLLFLAAANALAVCTTRLCSQGHLSGFQTKGIVGGVPLLQYADDTTFFIQGSETAACTLAQMMRIFSDFSGLQLNGAKSMFVGFGLAPEEVSWCTEILATPIGTLPIRYLGLPLSDCRLRIQDWQPMVEKVEKLLGGWRARVLSCGGCLVLVKSVLSAIPTYFMSVFRLPAGVRRCLEGIMRSFFLAWDLTGQGWEPGGLECGVPKFRHGDLGIRHLKHPNSALLSKWVVRVMQPSADLLSLLLKDAYGHTLDWGKWVTPRHRDSLVVASLRGIFPMIQSSFRPQLGDGAEFRFWTDNWTGQGRLADIFPRLFTLASDSAVSVRSVWTGEWTLALPPALSDQRLAHLLSLQLQITDIRPTTTSNDA